MLLQVYTDGYVTMQQKLLNSNPEKLPYGDYSMVAPFWSDIDNKGSTGGSVFYHLYDRYSIIQRQANDADTFLQRASHFLKNKQTIFANFDPVTALLVTWDKVNPYPAIETSPNQVRMAHTASKDIIRH